MPQILPEDSLAAATAHSGLLRLHEAVQTREPGCPEAALSPQELLALFRVADPTRNGACLPWLLKTYAAGGYRIEDLGRAHDTLQIFARLRQSLPQTDIIDGETRNPRKLGSHMNLASLWSAVKPLVEAEMLAKEDEVGEPGDVDRENALAQSRVLHRSNRMVVAVPMTEEASCWWGRGTQWCTAARKNNAFERYNYNAPLIVVCLRKCGDKPARKLQLYIASNEVQFMDENDAPVSLEIILERWQDLEALIHWAVGINGKAIRYIPEHMRTEALYLVAVGSDGWVLKDIPETHLTEDICLAAVRQPGRALQLIPMHLRTETIHIAAVDWYAYNLLIIPDHMLTEAICLAAVKQDVFALLHIPVRMRTEIVCKTAVDINRGVLKLVPEHLGTAQMFRIAASPDKKVSTPITTQTWTKKDYYQILFSLEDCMRNLQTGHCDPVLFTKTGMG